MQPRHHHDHHRHHASRPPCAPGHDRTPWHLAWLPVGLACALVCMPARPDTIEWTGNATTLTARGDFGFGFETREFALRPEWLAWCAAYPTASCAATTFWGSAGNWAGNRLPTLADDVLAPAGSTVVVNSYSSPLQGRIEGFGQARSLNAAGTVIVGGNASLIVGAADIADLQLSGVLFSDGRVSVGSFAGALGRLRGTGTTEVRSVADASFTLQVGGGHHLAFSGSFAGQTDIELVEQSTFTNNGSFNSTLDEMQRFWLYGQSSFINRATLGANGTRLSVIGAGTFNPLTQSRVLNLGTVEAGLSVNGARFDNDGLVKVGDGQTFSALFNGTHSGRFEGGAGSTLQFSNFGQPGHLFSAASSISSQGTVVFARGDNRVGGSYQAHTTQVGGNAAQVWFSGQVGALAQVVVDSGSSASFETAAAVSVDLLTLAGMATFNTGQVSRVGTARLRGAAVLTSSSALTVTDLLDLDGGSARNVDIQGDLRWRSGRIDGNSRVSGTSVWSEGQRSLGGSFTADTDTTWAAGSFSGWSGTLQNPAGRRIDLQGDHGIAMDSGRLINQGLLRKSGGSGTAVLGVAVDNSGAVIVDSGTLHLANGGRQSGLLQALPGAAILLGGDQVFTPSLQVQGVLDQEGGSLRLLQGGSFNNPAGRHIQPLRLNLEPGTQLTNDGMLAWNQATLEGQLDNRGALVAGMLENHGVLVNRAGATLLLNDFSGGQAGTSRNSGGGTITNLGTLQVGNAALQNVGLIDNHHQLLQGGNLTVGDAVLPAGGRIVNRPGAVFDNTGLLTLAGRGSFTNDGEFLNGGTLLIDAGTSLSGAGSFVQRAGLVTVDGVLQAVGGVLIDGGVLNGTGQLPGNLQFGPAGSIQPGHSPGTLIIGGDLRFTGTPDVSPTVVNLVIDIASAGSDLLRVGGTADLGTAAIEFRFAPGYTPVDGSSLTWLQAGRVEDGCTSGGGWRCPTVSWSGLGPDWTAALVSSSKGLRMDVIREPVTLDTASQIEAQAQVTVAAGSTASNWTDLDMERLDNRGDFHNRPGSRLGVYGTLTNAAGASFSNRGLIQSSELNNDGVLHNRFDGELQVSARFTNSGQMSNSGLLLLDGDSANSGSLHNRGTLRTWGLTNLAGGRIDNTGLIDLHGGGVRNLGTFTVSGLVQADGAAGIFNDSGQFTITADGSVLDLGAYLDVGGSTQVDGRLQAKTITLRHGQLAGSGTLEGTAVLSERSTVTAGPGAGTLTIVGDLVLAGVEFRVDLDGGANVHALHVTGQVRTEQPAWAFFRLLDGHRPAIGDSFSALTSSGGFVGTAFAGYTIYAELVVDGQTSQSLWFAPAGAVVHFDNGRVTITAVPEPATWLLWMLGLSGWLGWRRRSATGPA